MHNTVAISNTLGHPDVSITKICDPALLEISNELAKNQTAQKCSDLCTRKFHKDLQEKMFCIQVEGISGKIVADVQVIEFQKNGLLHAHYICFLGKESKDKLNNPEYIDTLTSGKFYQRVIQIFEKMCSNTQLTTLAAASTHQVLVW